MARHEHKRADRAGRSAALQARVASGLPLWREAFAGFDWLALRVSRVYAGEGVPRGDGSAVVTVPGMLASDASLAVMRGWLHRVGYAPYAAGIGRIARCPEALASDLAQTIDRAVDETGGPVRVIGHSLGGLLARGAAMRRPGSVSHVITLGSPVNGMRAHPLIAAAAQMMASDCDEGCVLPLQDALPRRVHETSIYSCADGIVDWRTCVRPAHARRIEVPGTHTGLIFNPDVYRALGTLLAEPPAAPSQPVRLPVPQEDESAVWPSRRAA